MSTADNPPLDRVRHDSPDKAAAWSQEFLREQAGGKRVWLYAGFLTIALIFLYASVFKELWGLWMTREDYSHGFLVPLISLYLLKAKWGELEQVPIEPAPVLGLGLLLLALAGCFIGVAGGVITLSSLSFIGTLMGLTLLLCGASCLRVLRLPLAYLVFMTPVLDVVVEPLHRPLQVLAAHVVSGLFAALGVPTYLDGTIIQFPNGLLEVAVQCSGAGYLISILAIGLPLAFVALHTWRSRVMLLTAALVISILANWARITLIGAVGYLTGWGPQVHGPLHILQGMLVYWIGFGALFAGVWILAKVERGKVTHARRPKMAPAPRIVPIWHTWRRLWWIALATLAAAIPYLYGYDRGPVAAKESFASLPPAIGQWTAVERRQNSPIVRIPGADQEVLRVYGKADGSMVTLYIAYLSSQTQGRELVNYLTSPLHQEAVEATITIGAESQPVNIGFFSGDRQSRKPILFWYALNGRAYADRYQAKAATIAQALMHEGSNGALVLIAGESKRDGQDIVVDDVEQFAQDLVPILRPYLP